MKSPTLRTLALEVALLASHVTKKVKQDAEKRIQAAGLGLGGLQYLLLCVLCHQPRTLNELSDLFRVTPATLVPVVDALEAKALLRRGQDPADRRRSPLSLTEAGVAAVARVGGSHVLAGPMVTPGVPLVASLQKMGEGPRHELLVHLRTLARHLVGSAEVARVGLLVRVLDASGAPSRAARRRSDVATHRRGRTAPAGVK